MIQSECGSLSAPQQQETVAACNSCLFSSFFVEKPVQRLALCIVGVSDTYTLSSWPRLRTPHLRSRQADQSVVKIFTLGIVYSNNLVNNSSREAQKPLMLNWHLFTPNYKYNQSNTCKERNYLFFIGSTSSEETPGNKLNLFIKNTFSLISIFQT